VIPSLSGKPKNPNTATHLNLRFRDRASMASAGKGQVISGFGTSVERIMINLTDVSPDLGDERGTIKHPHPFLSDINVRKALSMAIDRAQLLSNGGGSWGEVRGGINRRRLPWTSICIYKSGQPGCRRETTRSGQRQTSQLMTSQDHADTD